MTPTTMCSPSFPPFVRVPNHGRRRIHRQMTTATIWILMTMTGMVTTSTSLFVHSFQVTPHRISTGTTTTTTVSRMLLSHRQKQHRRRTNCPRANIKSSDHTVIKFRSIRSSRHNQINEDEQDYDGDELDSSDSYSDDDTNDISELLDSLPSSTKADMDKLTVPQLKQQLRLRNLKVSGKKQELLERLLVYEFQEEISTKKQNQSIRPTRKTADQLSSSPTSATAKDDDNVEVLMAAEQARQQLVTERRQKAEKIAEEYGQEFIDVTAYLDDEDKGKDVKSSIPTTVADDDDDDDGDEINTPSKDPEVWGSDARIVEDYEGRSPIVDGLSRVVVQFKGSNQTEIQAYVVASRDAMKAFLEGGQNRTTYTAAKDPEAQLREIQIKREQAEKRPTRSDDFDGSDDGDRAGYYADVLNRDYSDWGKYSVTGAQISAEEVQGVLLLSDVFGPFTEATKTLAEKIAFECQPVVCMVPDLFRGKPWKEDMTTPGFNEDGQDYEEWRSTHPDVRVSIDIRAAAAVLRERYGVSSIVVWGTCYGGGRALEVAAGYLPDDNVLDVDGSLAPRLVDPDVAVVWYPTRYNAKKLFGAERSPTLTSNDEQKQRNVAVMGVFAGKDKLPGATPDDATELKRLLEEDERIKDCMVKVFTDQDHGFAHNSLGKNEDDSDLDRFVDNEFGGAGRVSIGDGDAEVACLLSTAFMETYSRKFLPTVGVPIMLDDTAEDWNRDVVLRKSSKMRNVREELTKLEQGVMDVKQEGTRIDREDPDDDEILLKALREMDAKDGKYKIGEDDDISTAFEKLVAGDDSFQLF